MTTSLGVDNVSCRVAFARHVYIWKMNNRYNNDNNFENNEDDGVEVDEGDLRVLE